MYASTTPLIRSRAWLAGETHVWIKTYTPHMVKNKALRVDQHLCALGGTWGGKVASHVFGSLRMHVNRIYSFCGPVV